MLDWNAVLRSRTVWLNVAALIVAFCALPEFVAVIPETWLPYIAALTGMLNLLLRFGGSQPLKPVK